MNYPKAMRMQNELTGIGTIFTNSLHHKERNKVKAELQSLADFENSLDEFDGNFDDSEKDDAYSDSLPGFSLIDFDAQNKENTELNFFAVFE
jgi:hypothetical protein